MRLYHEEYRYRVAVVSYVSTPLSRETLAEFTGRPVDEYKVSEDKPRAYSYEVYEYKTYKAAKAQEKRLLAEGKSVLFQTAKVTWLTPEEFEAELSTLPKAME